MNSKKGHHSFKRISILMDEMKEENKKKTIAVYNF